jgi:hypothetical protein
MKISVISSASFEPMKIQLPKVASWFHPRFLCFAATAHRRHHRPHAPPLLPHVPRSAQGLRFISSLYFLNLSLLPCSSFPGGGDDWASGGTICPVFAQPFPAERILQVCPLLLFPSTVRDGSSTPTLTKLFVFGSESSYNILPTNFDFICKNYRVYMCTPMSYAGSAPALRGVMII